MTDPWPTQTRRDAATQPRRFAGMREYIPAFAVFLASLWITCGAISKSYLIGRLANPITHNDVNYLIDGIRRLLYIEINGFWAEVLHLYREPMHAPLSGYQAALGFYLFGFHDWAPYASNIIYLLVFLAACAWLLRGLPTLVVIAGLATIAGMPLASTTVSEFAPEIPLGVFTALGVLLVVRIHMFDLALGPRWLAGLCFGLGFLGKPTSFVFVPLVVCAALGVVFARDVILSGLLRSWSKAILPSSLQLLTSLWLPALYVLPNYDYYSDYFYLALFNKENIAAFGYLSDFKDNLLFYLTGPAGEYMFGTHMWAYVLTIAIGIAAASMRSDRLFIGRQLELLILVAFMWLLPTASTAKNALLGVPFGYLLGFLVVMAIGSIYRTIDGRVGIAVVSLLGAFLLVFGISWTRLANIPRQYWNDPAGARVILEKWRDAQDRFRAVMLGNTPDYYGRSVFLTNVGFYHTPTLWYWFLKQDPTLDWAFASLWQDSDPQHHISLIRLNRPDFVIAGERDNGLTFAPALIPGAAATENAVLAALWNDPTYKPVDQFYGPTGRTITVFQRGTAFAGWRPIAGLKPSGDTLQPWAATAPIAHLEAYAPDPTPAELTIDASGRAGDTVDVVVNRNRVGQLNFDASGRSSFTHPFDLALGRNDIVLRFSSDAPVAFERLLVIRKIGRVD
jgi:hypothetical protein